MSESRTESVLRELEKVDYLLDQVARAVEQQLVPRSTYDALAPRYLARRAELVAQLERPRPAVAPSAAMPAMHPRNAPSVYEDALGSQVAARTPVTRPAPKPVPWTTVLLLLGAFLVIVASAIFAVAVWDWLDALGKLAFLGAVTVGFYAAGWFAREKMDLASGGIVLTAVASALLLFDGWIIIDGYDLSGPMPWAAVLLVCSAVYWFTEVRLASGFFGVVGAVAQIGWWWLLGEGLGFPAPLRLAGIALVALAWRLAATRARDAQPFATLVRVLEWGATCVAVLAPVGILADLVRVGSADPEQVASAAVVALASGGILLFTRQVSQQLQRVAAAAAQFPFVLSLAVASMPSNPGSSAGSVWLAVAFGVAALLYAVGAALALGWPFAMLDVACEFGLALTLLRIFDASPRVGAVFIALLGAVWAGASRLARLGANDSRSLRETGFVAEVASFVALVGASLAVLSAADTWPSTDVIWPVLAVLAMWAAALVVRWRIQLVAGTMAWSFVCMLALVDRFMVDPPAGGIATAVVAVAGAWLLTTRFSVERPFGRTAAFFFKLVVRVLILFVTFAGVMFEYWSVSQGSAGTWPMALVSFTLGAVFLADAATEAFTEPLKSAEPHPRAGNSPDRIALLGAPFTGTLVEGASAAMFSAAVGTAGLVVGVRALGGILAQAQHASLLALWPVLSGGVAAVVLAVLAWPVRRLSVSLARGAACGAVVGAILTLTMTTGESQVLAAGFALLALTLVTAAPTTSELLHGAAGIALLAGAWFALAWLEPEPVMTAVSIAVLGFAISVPSLLPRLQPGGIHALAGWALAVAGVVAQGSLVMAALVSLGGSVPAWVALGEHGLGAGLLCLAALVLVQAIVRHVEPGLYVGWALILLALLVELNAFGIEQAEVYTTAIALYLVSMGYLWSYMRPGRGFPIVLDAAAVVIGLGLPLKWSLTPLVFGGLTHALWAVGLALAALCGGFLARSRWLFFGGAASLAAVAFYRSFSAMAEFWWVWLGLIGMAMLVIALTWERQRIAITDARERIRLRFEGWR